jgi:predicted glycoside hydrolase/deacetylase ChbG (UPF0249 family)
VKGLLIVNADDWGYDAPTTDAIRGLWEQGRITSTSAMVYMEDSERAAAIAREVGIPTGLHLNLSEPYSGSPIPADVRERQARLAAKYTGTGLRLRRWVYDPWVRADVEDCIADQLARFLALYGDRPTHLDGHMHAHLSPNVLFARTLSPGTKVRNSLDRTDSRWSPLAFPRRLRRRLLANRFNSTERLFDATDWRTAFALAKTCSVELMVHPVLRDSSLLLSEEWSSALADKALGSFADLRACAERC